MRLKSWASNFGLGIVAVVAVGIVTGVHVKTQAPFLVFGSSSGSSQVIKSTSNALWVSLQSGGNIGTQTFANGTSVAPSIQFVRDTNAGFYSRATGRVDYAFGSTNYIDLGTNGITLNANGAFAWASGDASLSPDTSLVRAAAGEITTSSVAFAALGTPANGTFTFCSDCAPTTPATCPATKASCVCAGSGTGALAVRLNGVWDCGTFQ